MVVHPDDDEFYNSNHSYGQGNSYYNSPDQIPSGWTDDYHPSQFSSKLPPKKEFRETLTTSSKFIPYEEQEESEIIEGRSEYGVNQKLLEELNEKEKLSSSLPTLRLFPNQTSDEHPFSRSYDASYEGKKIFEGEGEDEEEEEEWDYWEESREEDEEMLKEIDRSLSKINLGRSNNHRSQIPFHEEEEEEDEEDEEDIWEIDTKVGRKVLKDKFKFNKDEFGDTIKHPVRTTPKRPKREHPPRLRRAHDEGEEEEQDRYEEMMEYVGKMQPEVIQSNHTHHDSTSMSAILDYDYNFYDQENLSSKEYGKYQVDWMTKQKMKEAEEKERAKKLRRQARRRKRDKKRDRKRSKKKREHERKKRDHHHHHHHHLSEHSSSLHKHDEDDRRVIEVNEEDEEETRLLKEIAELYLRIRVHEQKKKHDKEQSEKKDHDHSKKIHSKTAQSKKKKKRGSHSNLNPPMRYRNKKAEKKIIPPVSTPISHHTKKKATTRKHRPSKKREDENVVSRMSYGPLTMEECVSVVDHHIVSRLELAEMYNSGRAHLFLHTSSSSSSNDLAPCLVFISNDYQTLKPIDLPDEVQIFSKTIVEDLADPDQLYDSSTQSPVHLVYLIMKREDGNIQFKELTSQVSTGTNNSLFDSIHSLFSLTFHPISPNPCEVLNSHIANLSSALLNLHSPREQRKRRQLEGRRGALDGNSENSLESSRNLLRNKITVAQKAIELERMLVSPELYSFQESSNLLKSESVKQTSRHDHQRSFDQMKSNWSTNPFVHASSSSRDDQRWFLAQQRARARRAIFDHKKGNFDLLPPTYRSPIIKVLNESIDLEFYHEKYR